MRSSNKRRTQSRPATEQQQGSSCGIPMLLVIALDAVLNWQYGPAAVWLVTLLTLLVLAGIGLWPLMDRLYGRVL